MAEGIEVLFGVKTLGDPKNTVPDGGPDPHTARGCAVGEYCPLYPI